FMEIINKDRVGADRFNSSEVFQLLRENYGVTDTQAVADTQAVTEEVMEGVADAATAEPIKIEEIRDEAGDGKVFKGKPHNNSQELKTYVGELFATPRYAGGTTECTVCRFHHPTPRDPVFFSQFYVLPTTESEQDYYDQIVGNRSGESLPSEEKKRGLRIPKWLQRDCDKYRDLPMPSGELLKNLSRGIFDSRSGENDTSEFKSDYYGSCDYRSQTLETGEDPWGSSCEDRM
ncbi:uncharacterized protein LOC103522736, partial [Diaphorina citri]|uniref:Uncharacterized protein LOC103522736 n=1 Tax=Diaphorina citri TaxID=121845 RepID=A0A1S3DQT9_DIACI